MKTGNRIISATFAAMMVLGLFAGVFAGGAAAVGPSTAPVVTITAPANNTITGDNFMNVTWSVSGLGASIGNWNWTRTYLVGATPGAYVNVSHNSFRNLTFTENGKYKTDVFTVNKTASGYDNSTVKSVVYTIAAYANIDILFPAQGGHYNKNYVLGHWNVTNVENGVANISVKLDAGAFVVIDWNATKNFTGLSNGVHTITVRAISNGTAHYTNTKNVSFTIDTVAPTVTNFLPAGTAVPLQTSMVITFSEEMNQDSLTVTVTPIPAGLGDPVWSNANKTATLLLQSAHSTRYSALVEGTDLAGNALTGQVTYNYSSVCFVTGIVTDANGNVLSGANVTVTSTLAGGPTYYATSSGTGSFGVLAAAGNYNVKITKSGYTEVDKNGVAVGAGLPTNNLGTLKMSNAMDWTVPIIIIVIGIIVVVVLVVALRRRK